MTANKEHRAAIEIDEHYCKGCGLCVAACPQHVICISEAVSPQGYYAAQYTDPEGKCTGCTACAIMCPDVAIEVFKVKRPGGKV